VLWLRCFSFLDYLIFRNNLTLNWWFWTANNLWRSCFSWDFFMFIEGIFCKHFFWMEEIHPSILSAGPLPDSLIVNVQWTVFLYPDRITFNFPEINRVVWRRSKVETLWLWLKIRCCENPANHDSSKSRIIKKLI